MPAFTAIFGQASRKSSYSDPGHRKRLSAKLPRRAIMKSLGRIGLEIAVNVEQMSQPAAQITKTIVQAWAVNIRPMR
jgi:hypothetical protein